jgi:beclin
MVSLELYSSGDLPLGRQILHRKFNEAMVAFLDCLKQLGDHVSSTDAAGQRGEGLKLPYNIEKDKINGISIKLGASQDEQWTSACKYTLTCCKFLLAHASNEKNRREH